MRILTLRGNDVGLFDAEMLKMFTGRWEIRQWDSRKKKEELNNAILLRFRKTNSIWNI